MILRAALAFMLALAAMGADAQSGKRPDGRERQMSPEQRERMRDDVRDANRQRGEEQPQNTRQMSPEEPRRFTRIELKYTVTGSVAGWLLRSEPLASAAWLSSSQPAR
jgi:hypothetical protein